MSTQVPFEAALAGGALEPEKNAEPVKQEAEKPRGKPGPKPKPQKTDEVQARAEKAEVAIEKAAEAPTPTPAQEEAAPIVYPDFKPLRAVIGDTPVKAISGSNVEMHIRPQLLNGVRALVIPPRARIRIKTDNLIGGDVLNSSDVVFERGFSITPARFLGPVEVVITNQADTRLAIADGEIVGQFL